MTSPVSSYQKPEIAMTLQHTENPDSGFDIEFSSNGKSRFAMIFYPTKEFGFAMMIHHIENKVLTDFYLAKNLTTSG